MDLEYDFTLVTRPHHAYGRFVHVDAVLDEPLEILRYAASEGEYPSGISFGMDLQEEVEYDVMPVTAAKFERILDAWRELSKQTIANIHSTEFRPALGGTAFCLAVTDRGITSQFTWHAVSGDETPFDRLIELLVS